MGFDGPLSRYVKLRLAHAPGMPGTVSPPPRVSDPDMHHDTCVTYVPWCMPGLLTSGFLWSRWRWKPARHSRCMRNTQFYLSGKRPIAHVRWSRKSFVLKNYYRRYDYHRYIFCHLVLGYLSIAVCLMYSNLYLYFNIVIDFQKASAVSLTKVTFVESLRSNT